MYVVELVDLVLYFTYILAPAVCVHYSKPFQHWAERYSMILGSLVEHQHLTQKHSCEVESKAWHNFMAPAGSRLIGPHLKRA